MKAAAALLLRDLAASRCGSSLGGVSHVRGFVAQSCPENAAAGSGAGDPNASNEYMPPGEDIGESEAREKLPFKAPAGQLGVEALGGTPASGSSSGPSPEASAPEQKPPTPPAAEQAPLEADPARVVGQGQAGHHPGGAVDGGMRDPTRAVPVAEDARPEDRQFTQEPRPNPSSQP